MPLRHFLFKATAMVSFLTMSATSAFSQTTTLHELMNPSLSENIIPVPKVLSREQRNNELSVKTRRSPSYDPQNVRFGEFIFAPSIETFTQFNDNVYAQENNKESDIIFGVRPELSIRSDLPLHQIEGKFFYEDGNYKDITEEDYEDFGGALVASFDAYPGFSVPFALGYTQSHSRRDEPEDRRSVDPVVFTVLSGGTGARLTGDFLEVNARTGFQTLKFDDTTSFTGTPVDNSNRDRTAFTHSLTVGFPQEAIVAPFVYGSYKQTSYENDRGGFSRDSHDVEGGIGSYFGISDVTKSMFKIGKVKREFDDSSLDTFDALTYQANLNWDMTTLAALSLSGKREIRETSTSASAQLESSVGLSMTYELAPNIFLKPSIGYRIRDYQDSDLKTKAYTGDMEAMYKLNPNLWASLEYNGISQEVDGITNDPNADNYKQNIVTLSLKFQL